MGLKDQLIDVVTLPRGKEKPEACTRKKKVCCTRDTPTDLDPRGSQKKLDNRARRSNINQLRKGQRNANKEKEVATEQESMQAKDRRHNLAYI
jgi:hypothetical protein